MDIGLVTGIVSIPLVGALGTMVPGLYDAWSAI